MPLINFDKYANALIIITFFLGLSQVFAQKETDKWYFGRNSGLDFSTSPPTPLTNGKLYTEEGCSSISDKKGNLLFYTDGSTIYNKNHLLMESGLHGSFTSAQSALIIPNPGHSSIYYVFTAGQGGYIPNGDKFREASYSEVNMCLNNGLGGVISSKKNIVLNSNVTEKLTAVLHQNGTDIWVMYHAWESNSFLAYLITAEGVKQTPVISKCGTVHKDFPPQNPHYFNQSFFANTLGEMKFSAQGDKLALAEYQINIIELFDFDNFTGVISNVQTLQKQDPNKFQGLTFGIGFSPDGNQLYATNTILITKRSTGVDSINNKLVKYNLNAGNTQDIINSVATLYSYYSNFEEFGTLQLAIDGKLYCQRGTLSLNSDILGVIGNPNSVDINNIAYQHNGVFLHATYPNQDVSTFLGLPNFLASYFTTSPYIISNPSCNDRISNFKIINDKDIIGVKWNFGDSLSGQSNVSNSFNPSHAYSLNGIYEANAIITLSNNSTKKIIKKIYIDYLSDNFLGKDTAIEIGQTFTIDLTNLNSVIAWQDGSTNLRYTVSKPGTYWAEICKDGCSKKDTINVLCKRSTITLGPDKVVCDKSFELLDASIPGGEYLWQDGSQNSQFKVTKTGKYYALAKNQCGAYADTVNITFENSPKLSFTDTTICYGKKMELDLSYLKQQGYVLRSDNLKGSILEFSLPGIYKLTLNTKNCIYQYEVKISFDECNKDMMVPNVFTPNGDLQNESFKLIGFEPGKWALHIFNRIGKEVFSKNAYTNDWNGDGLSSGVYYYFLQDSKSDKSFKGWVEIIR